MALNDTKYLSILFTELDNYSLRGNSALWETLKDGLIKTGQGYSAKQLCNGSIKRLPRLSRAE